MTTTVATTVTDVVIPTVVSAAQNTYVLGALGLAAAGFVGMKVKAALARKAFMAKVAAMPKGVVYLYAILPRIVGGTPHIGHNIVKVEAFLRANKIPYEFHFMMDCGSYSPTETVPFIAIDGELIGESQFCVDAIKKRFNLAADEGLTAGQTAVFTAIRRIVDLSAYQHNSRTTFVDNPAVMKNMMQTKFAPLVGLPGFVVGYMVGKFRSATINRLNVSGLGWLDDERYQVEYMRDVQALSAFVAEADARGHDYLFGNKPTSVDCMLYGFIASLKAFPKMTNNTRAIDFVVGDKTLGAYAKRFEQEFYPDLSKIAPSKFETQRFTSYGKA
jgi:hypothetical protein